MMTHVKVANMILLNVLLLAATFLTPSFGQLEYSPYGINNGPFYGQNNQLGDQPYPNNQQIDPFGNSIFLPNSGPGYNYENVYNPFNRPQNTNPPRMGIEQLRCPQHWVQFQQSCYRFIRSPVRNRNDARRNCQAFKSDLLSINSYDEHGFILYQLLGIDPQHRKWYTSIRQQGPALWVNDGDGTPLMNMENAFLPGQDTAYGKDYIVYSFSDQIKRWGYEAVRGDEQLVYICEVPISVLHYLNVDDRTYLYGIDITDPETIPRGPFFVRQPKDVVFDLTNRRINNDLVIGCLAGGYPNPTYQWFKEEYVNDVLQPLKIDPLSDIRLTISGGSLIINNPKQTQDRGSYHCKASNIYGTIISESVSVSFGFIGEFNLKRSPEQGNQNWGKAIFCDPPQHFPAVSYYWNRDYFPNFVEEDQRVFVSFDGALYFSSLQEIDRGNYSCSTKSRVSEIGRNGPFFQLLVNPNPNSQQLKFPNNFPKAFPEAPMAGKEVRLECVAFGYPVPYYNWTRRGAPLPKTARTENFNRVLIIPHAAVEDQGEYNCRAYNDRAAIENTVTLSIQAEPNFTIPLTDKHMDLGADLAWTCEAFGIPDVNYTWFRNGQLLNPLTLPADYKDRYFIQDNVLTIKYLDPQKDPAMFQCRARNQLRTRYSSGQLRVLSFRPTFQKRPLEPETYASDHGNVTIACNPEAAPRPKFIWRKDGNIIGSGGRRQILENGNLIISPVSRDDEGIYVCIASNDYGKDESSGRLIVLRTPQWLQPLPERIVVAVMQNFTMQCIASFDEILDTAYVWTRNGMKLKDYGHESIRIVADGGYLHITNTSFTDGGEYECTVMSAVGHLSTKTIVEVQGEPGPPGGVNVVSITSSTATIQWTDGAANGRPIVLYRISARTNWNSTWSNITDLIPAREVDRYNKRKEVILENVLSPWSAYEFRVSAINELGHSIPSFPSPQHSTQSDRPYKAPTKIGGGGGKIGDLTITWKPLPLQDQNGPGIFYKIFWRRHNANNVEFQTQELKAYGNTGVAVVQIETEFFFTEYDVKVQAINDIGKGPESTVQVILSAEDMPRVAPQDVFSKAFNSTALNVTWSAIDMQRDLLRGKLIGHRLKYWKRNYPEESAIYYLSRKTRTWALIVGLQPDTYYYVKVMAYNAAGEGPESERYLERTYRKAPQKPPSSVHAYGVNPNTIRVVWRYVSPSADEEPVIGYKVRVWQTDQDLSRANDTYVPVGQKLEAYIDNLSPAKVYNLRVLAFSNGGDGRMSSPALTFQMAPNGSIDTLHQEKCPTNLYVTAVNSTALNVTWDAPTLRAVQEDPLMGYMVQFWEENQVEESSRISLVKQITSSAIINDLKPNTSYFVRVKTIFTNSISNESEKYLQRTHRLAPQNPPTDVNATIIDSSTAQVVWTSAFPNPGEEMVMGYQVRVWDTLDTSSESVNIIAPISIKLKAFIHDLIPGRKYYIGVLPLSDGGEGRMSHPLFELMMIPPPVSLLHPRCASSKAVNATAITVRWKKSNMKDHTKHTLKFWKTNQNEGNATTSIIEGTADSATVGGFEPSTDYIIKVIPYSEKGENPKTETCLQSTYKKAPQLTPTLVGATGINSMTVKVKWEGVDTKVDEEPLIGYKIRIWEGDNPIPKDKLIVKNTDSEYDTYLHNLTRGQRYHLAVLAFSKGGEGPLSFPATWFRIGRAGYERVTASNIAPEKLVCKALNATTISLTWEPIDMPGVIGYRWKHWKSKSPEEKSAYSLRHTKQTTIIMRGLNSNTKYLSRVVAFDNALQSHESLSCKAKTFKKAPQQKPILGQVHYHNLTSGRVTWTYSKTQPPDEEPVIGFKIKLWTLGVKDNMLQDFIVDVNDKYDLHFTKRAMKYSVIGVFAYSLGGDGQTAMTVV